MSDSEQKTMTIEEELELSSKCSLDPDKDGSPIMLEGFTRYLIYPSGRVYDRKRMKNVHMNRMLNFIMWPDVPVFDEVTQKNKPSLENLRMLMQSLIRQKTPGFEVEIPPYRPPEMYHPLGSPEDELETAQLREQLHLLRTAEKVSMRLFLEDVDNTQAKDSYKHAKEELDAFKEKYPLHYKWRSYASGSNDGEFERKKAEFLEIEEEIDEELEMLNKKARKIQKRLWAYKRW